MRLAREVVAMYHGQEKAVSAEAAFTNTFKHGEVPHVRIRPQVLVAFDLPVGGHKRGLGRQTACFGLCAHPEVVPALGIFGIAHDAAQIDLSVDVDFVPDDGDDWNPLPGPVAAGVQRVVAVEDRNRGDGRPLDC